MTHCARRRSFGLAWALRLACLGVLVLAGGVLFTRSAPAAPGTPGTPAGVVAALSLAQTPTAPGGPEATAPARAEGKTPTFTDLFRHNLVVNSLIIGLSVVAVMLFIYYLMTINTRSMMPAAFVDEVTRLALGKRYSEAADYCRQRQHILAASILQRCFENADKELPVLMQIIDSEGQRRADLVWNRIGYLIDVSVIAPMLGLLGTVLGMLYAFMGLEATTAGTGLRTRILAGSIGAAMGATLFGLAVAILALVFHTIVKARTVRTLAEVEQVVHSVADHVKRGTP